MRLSLLFIAAAAGTLVSSSPGLTQANNSQRPAQLKRVVDCRAVPDSTERLACYDREVAALDTAEARRDVVVMDREQIRSTRRTLFGLPIPSLGFLKNDSDPDEEGLSRLETTIKAVTQNPSGKWVFTLEHGGVWAQVDSRNLSVDPRPGHEIKIRRAAMGSYLANVRGQTAIRVQRLR